MRTPERNAIGKGTSVQATETSAEKTRDGAMMNVSGAEAGATAVSDVMKVANEIRNEIATGDGMNVDMKMAKEEEAEIDHRNGASIVRRQESVNSGKSARKKRKWNAK